VENVDKFLALLSLVVAALAVFIRLLISSKIATKKLAGTIKISNKHTTSPIRQSWINELRQILVKLITNCTYFFSETNKEKRDSCHLDVCELIGQLELYVNSKGDEHNELFNFDVHIEFSIFSEDKPNKLSQFWFVHRAIVEQSQTVLKTQWQRIKMKYNKLRMSQLPLQVLATLLFINPKAKHEPNTM
jgi:hypothetical protein